MMRLGRLDLLFWVAGLVGHIVLLFVLFGRRRVSEFPAFTALIAGNVIRTLVLYAAFHRGTEHTYSFLYWSMAILDVIFQICVVYELAAHVFRGRGEWARDTRRDSIWILCGSVAIAGGLSWLAAPVTSTWEELLVVKVSFFSSALMSELFVGMTALSFGVGLPWKTHVAKISQGLGVYSVVDILIEAGHTLYGAAYSTRLDTVLSHIRIAAYIACLGYWIITLWRNAPPARDLPGALGLRLFTLEKQVAFQLHTVRSWRKQ